MSLSPYIKNPNLLNQALTHRSWVNENPNRRETNERLEFLGDAVLEFIVSEKLYTQFPDQPEGYLTTLRSNLVNTTSLAGVAKSLNLGGLLFVSKGEEDTGGRENPSLLADTLEAVIGAIYLDSGIETASKFIDEHLMVQVADKLKLPLKDAKSRLQEYVQALGYPAPKYVVASQEGPDHAKIFIIEVMVNSEVWGKGKGKNKGEAAQQAATAALLSKGI